jgi:uncharacterized membrane protein
MSDTVRPPGWAHNPSSWGQRVPLILWALAGFGIAVYLSLFQLKLIEDVWEPFFGDGTRRVLTSEISYVLPIPDALLGALGYLVDAVTGAVGGKRRWRTMPWMVLLFGLMAGPMGLVGVLLVILQPVWVGGWCTLCLVSAVISVGIMSPSLDEALASLQFLKREKRQGRSLWRAFWGGRRTTETELPSDPRKPGESAREEPRFNWIQTLNVAAGVWLMAAPAALGYVDGRANDWIIGPLVASFAVLALWEFMVPVRWVNLPLGAWMTASSFFLYSAPAGRWNAVLCGLFIMGASLLRGTHRPALFGGGWSVLWKKTQEA